jgi:predicted amidohydrolase YtcJ
MNKSLYFGLLPILLLILLVLCACSCPPVTTTVTQTHTVTYTPPPETPSTTTPAATTTPVQYETADIVFINGNVLTMEEDMPQAEALAVKGETILAVGSYEEIELFIDSQTRIIDLHGKTLMPGFVDSHNHVFNDAYSMGLTSERSQQIALEKGITTMANMYCTPDFVQQMQAFEQQGKLLIRTSLYLNYNTNCGNNETWNGESLGNWYLSYTPDRDPTQMLRIIGVKIYSDGGSCLLPAFSVSWHDPQYGDTTGYLFIEENALAAVITEAQSAGFQVAIHSIGDRAIETCINAIGTALDGQPNTYRHRIEHNTFIRPELLTRYGELGIVASVYRPRIDWLFAPTWYGTAVINASGGVARSWFEQYRSLLEVNPGLHVCWQSDWPWIGMRPVDDLHAFVTRNQLMDDGETIYHSPDWLTAEAVGVHQALRMMTIEAAYALFMEDMVGSLRPGKYADLIVLSDNPLTMPLDSLTHLDVLFTMVGGQELYSAEGLEPANATGSISGYVYSSDGVTPVQGARVSVFDKTTRNPFAPQSGTTLTDVNGYYKVDGLPMSNYMVAVIAGEQGYAAEWYHDAPDAGDSTPIWLDSSADITAINFTLDAGGCISGTVTFDDNGTLTPLANVLMVAINIETLQWSSYMLTDADGHYTLGVPNGNYCVTAYPPFSGVAYISEWYDNHLDISDYDTITVTGTADIQNIDFTLDPYTP